VVHHNYKNPKVNKFMANILTCAMYRYKFIDNFKVFFDLGKSLRHSSKTPDFSNTFFYEEKQNSPCPAISKM